MTFLCETKWRSRVQPPPTRPFLQTTGSQAHQNGSCLPSPRRGSCCPARDARSYGFQTFLPSFIYLPDQMQRQISLHPPDRGGIPDSSFPPKLRINPPSHTFGPEVARLVLLNPFSPLKRSCIEFPFLHQVSANYRPS